MLFAEVISSTEFCLGSFTAKGLKYDFCFKLGGEVSSFRYRNSPFSRLLLYHNLFLEGGPNFRWQYTVLTQPTFSGSRTLPAASSCLHDFHLRTAHKIGVLCASTRIEFFRTIFLGGWLGRKRSWRGGGPEEKNMFQRRNQEGRIVEDLQRFNSKLVRLEASSKPLLKVAETVFNSKLVRLEVRV